MHTLEEVVGAFEAWRVSRANRKEPIPERLWILAKSLLPFYMKSHIQKALRVSGRQFNEHCMTIKGQKEVRSSEDGFAVGDFKTELLFHDGACELTLNGKHKSLQIKTNIRNMSHVLSLVEGYL